MPAKKSSPKRPAATRPMNKKSMKRTKGGLLPAVNVGSAIKMQQKVTPAFTGGVMPSAGEITI